MAWPTASPVSAKRRKIKNTPSGGPARARAITPASARRMNANSVKGAIKISCNTDDSLQGKNRSNRESYLGCPHACLRTPVEGLHHSTRFEQILRGQDGGGFPLCDFLPREQQSLREMRPHEIKIMRHDKHGAFLL